MTSAVDWRDPSVAFALTRDGLAFKKENGCTHTDKDVCDRHMPFAPDSRDWRLQQLCCIIRRGPTSVDKVENSLVDSLEYLAERIKFLESSGDPEGLVQGHKDTFSGHFRLFGNLIQNLDRLLKRGFITLVDPHMYTQK